MNVFEADSRLAYTSGVVAAVVAVILALAFVVAAVLVPLTLATWAFAVGALACLALAGWLAFQTHQLASTSYSIDRNALVIRWGQLREVVPMGDVQRVLEADEIADGLRMLRAPLPGWWFGEGRHPALGKIRFYATAPLDHQVLIVTPERSYAVSPYDDEAFLDAFRTRLEMRPTQNVAHTRLLPPYMALPVWTDRIAQVLLILAIALNLLTFGLSAGRFPAVPAQLALHFDAAGSVDRFGDKPQLFVPPLIALITLAISVGLGLALYRNEEKLAAYMLWGGAIAIQALFFVATATIGFTLPS